MRQFAHCPCEREKRDDIERVKWHSVRRAENFLHGIPQRKCERAIVRKALRVQPHLHNGFTKEVLKVGAIIPEEGQGEHGEIEEEGEK